MFKIPIWAAWANSVEAAPGAVAGDSASVAAVGRVFVPIAEFVAGVSALSAASAAYWEHFVVPASDVPDLASAEVSGVLFPVGRRAFLAVSGISGPSSGPRCWEQGGVCGREARSDEQRCCWDAQRCSLTGEGGCNFLPLGRAPLRDR